MEKAEVIHQAVSLPLGLMTIEEAATYALIDRETIETYCISGHCPHYRVNKGPFFFAKKEFKKWVEDNFVEHQDGKNIPRLKVLTSVIQEVDFSTETVPIEIRNISGLCRMHTHSAVSGVYFLCNKGKVIYIGQATNVYVRPFSHVDKEFDSIYYIPVPKEFLNKVEGALIRTLTPPRNVSSNGRVNAPVVENDMKEIINNIFSSSSIEERI